MVRRPTYFLLLAIAYLHATAHTWRHAGPVKASADDLPATCRIQSRRRSPRFKTLPASSIGRAAGLFRSPPRQARVADITSRRKGGSTWLVFVNTHAQSAMICKQSPERLDDRDNSSHSRCPEYSMTGHPSVIVGSISSLFP